MYPVGTWGSVNENYDELVRYTKGLTTQGATALGSALAIALGLAKKHKELTGGASTEIFLCTDGASNTGIGSTDAQYATQYSRFSNDHGRQFYSLAGETALGYNAKINIIGIEGEVSKSEMKIV
jgi:Mg-chelatase subunit ChlD